MKIKPDKKFNHLKQKPGVISPRFKKMSYLHPIKTNNSFKNSNPNVNASEAMTNFFNANQINHNHCAMKYNNQHQRQTPKKNVIKFKSNKIAEEEISMVKNMKKDYSYIEALINKSIDYSRYQNSSLLGKSILDFSLNQSKSKKDQLKDNMRPVYNSSDYDKQSESSINFKYGTEPISINNNIIKVVISPIKQKKELSISKINGSKRKIEKEKDQKENALMIKAHYLKDKSMKSNSQSKTVKSIKTNNIQKQKINSSNENKCRFNNFGNFNDYEEEKERKYPFKYYQSNSNNNLLIHQEEEKKFHSEQSNHNDILPTDIDLLVPKSGKDNQRTSNGKLKDNGNNRNVDNNEVDGNEEDDCNVEDTSVEDYGAIQTSMIYQFKPISTMNEIMVKTDIQKTETNSKYNSIVCKYLFSDVENISKSKDNNSSLNDSHSQIDQDLEEITSVKEKMIKIEEYYSNQIKKMQYEMNKLDNSKLQLDDSLISKVSLPTNNKEGNIKAIINKLDTLEQSLSQKTNQYKSTIQSLIDELKDVSKTGITINNALLKETNDFLNEEDYYKKDNDNNNDNDKYNDNDNDNDKIYKINDSINNSHQFSNILLTTELERFKQQEALYKFEIPLKYQMSNKVKCIKEQVIKGKIVLFYDNNAIDIIDKRKTIKRIFPDGYEIWYYNNKDIQQKSPNGPSMFYYHKNKSYEFRYIKGKFLVYKFSSGQYEKHYFDNSKSIKFADGSFRITRPNGEELIQFKDGTMQLIGKNDKVKAMTTT